MPSTVNNVDLVPKEALNELKELDKQIRSTTVSLNGLLDPIAKIVTNLSKATNSVEGLRKAEGDLGKTTQQTTKILDEDAKLLRQRAQLINRINATQSIAAQEVAQYREGLRQINQEQRIQAKEALAAANSIEQLRARVASLKQEWAKADMGSAKFKQLSKDLAKANADLSKAEASVGIYSRNVGNYSSAFSPLKLQVQQVARELPSLTISAQQFFLAISNNLPMLTDELARAKQKNDELRKSGEKGVPVWKQLLSAIGSWQTLLVVGITVITAYGKEIGNFFKELFNGSSIIRDAQNRMEDYNRTIADDNNLSGKIVSYRALQKQWIELGNEAKKQTEFLTTYKNELDNIESGIDSVTEAESIFIRNSDNYIESLKNRAMAEAAYADAIELIKKQREAQNKLDEGPGWWDKTKEVLDGIGKLTLPGGIVGSLINGNFTTWVSDAFDQITNPSDWYNWDLEDKIKEYGTEIENVITDYVDFIDKYKNELNEVGIVDDNKMLRELEKWAQKIREIAQAESDATRELQALWQQQSVDGSEKIYQDDKESYADRLAALEDFIEQSKKLIQMQAENEILELRINTAEELGLDLNNPEDREKVYKATANRELVIREKMEAEFTAITQNGAEAREDILKQEAQDRINAIQSIMSDQNMRIDESEQLQIQGAQIEYTTNLDAAGGNSRKAAKATEEYNKKVKEIQDKADLDRLKAAQNVAQQIFDETVRGAEEGLFAEEDVEEARRNLKKASLDYEREINQQSLENSKEKSQEEIKNAEETKQKRIAILQSFLKVATEIGNSLFEISLSRLEAEAEANQEWADEQTERVEKLEESGAISKEQADARKEVISQKEKEREKEIAKQQAKIKKQQTIFDIIMSTAAGIIGVWANPGFPAAIPLAITVGALGAVQLATAMAQPIPEYAKGTQNHPGGLAIVGDAGRSEIVRTPGGGLYQTPSTDTLINLPKHSVVYPSIEAAMKDIDAITPRLEDSMQLLPRLNGTRHEGTVINFDVDKITTAQDRSTRVLNQILHGVNKDRANRRYYAMKANIRHTKTMN